MNLQSLLAARVQAGRPVRVGLIGAGKFGSMFLAQVPSIAGLEVARICDRDLDRAKAACRTVGWEASRIAQTRFSERGRDACLDQDVDVVVEATGDPAAGIAHALAAIEARKPIVMVNVEADALAGPWLAAKARTAGVIYSLAYGDQPALIAEMVDWARSLAHQLAEELRPAGVGIGQWAVLMFLWARDGMSQAELSRVVAIEPPTMVRTIDRMVRDGLVTRVPDPDDGRVTRIRLTERGRSLRDELVPKATAVNARNLNRITEREGRTLKTTARQASCRA